MERKHYIQVFIDGKEENLPLRDIDNSIIVFVGRGNKPVGIARYDFETKEWFNNEFEIITPEYWLLEVPMPTEEWISVKDRLPDREIACLVWPNKYQYVALYNLWGRYAEKWTVDDENGYEVEVNVTHWMPLPTPPDKEITNLK